MTLEMTMFRSDDAASYCVWNRTRHSEFRCYFETPEEAQQFMALLIKETFG